MKIITLTGQLARRKACQAINESPEGYVVKISEPKKTRDQEAKYHAMIGEVADQFMHCERKWDADDMKRLLVDQFRRDTAHMDEFKALWASIAKVDLAPSLDGSGVVHLGAQTRKFPKKLASAFIEWLNAFASEKDVVWSDMAVPLVSGGATNNRQEKA